MSQNRSADLRVAAISLLESSFGSDLPAHTVFAPGRVNLIGEHIDYHDLPVLPIALERGICVAFFPRSNSEVNAVSAAVLSGPVGFTFSNIAALKVEPGNWGNYLKAAALVACRSFGVIRGIHAVIVSDLPVAAGLSSSSALLVAMTCALLFANNIEPTLAELMSVLPEGEQFVGTRGGGMDHAAILASHEGSALYLRFNPFAAEHVPVPKHWCFLVADSLHAAEKSAALRGEYNARRQAGIDALQTLGLASYREALRSDWRTSLVSLTDPLQRDAFSHVLSEALRVEHAVVALRSADLQTFGSLLNESHRSLRDSLLVSTPAVDRLVTTALEAGAVGARITGAGFGGCIVAVCHRNTVDRVRDTLKLRHYAGLSEIEVARHLFIAEPAAGALEILRKNTEAS